MYRTLRSLVLLAAAAAPFGCNWIERAEPEPPAPASPEIVRSWQRIVAIEETEKGPVRRPAGYLCLQRPLGAEEGEYLVYDLHHRQLGFVLPSGRSYRFERNESGDLVPRETAAGGLAVGVQRILGVQGHVVFEPITAKEAERPRSEEKAREGAPDTVPETNP